MKTKGVDLPDTQPQRLHRLVHVNAFLHLLNLGQGQQYLYLSIHLSHCDSRLKVDDTSKFGSIQRSPTDQGTIDIGLGKQSIN